MHRSIPLVTVSTITPKGPLFATLARILCWETAGFHIATSFACYVTTKSSLTLYRSSRLCQDILPSKLSFRLMRSLKSMSTAANMQASTLASTALAASPMFDPTRPPKSPGALASESSTPSDDETSNNYGPDGGENTCAACQMLGHLLDENAGEKAEAKLVVENLRSDDISVVLMTTKALSDFCDVFCVGVRHLPSLQPARDWTCSQCALRDSNVCHCCCSAMHLTTSVRVSNSERA